MWSEMSRDSLVAANSLETVSTRSSISRYYYAAYQAVTAVLHYRADLAPPEEREAWNHMQTPLMVRDHFGISIRSTKTLNNLVSSLTYLYKLRIFADYISVNVEGMLDKARKEAGFLVRTCEGILHEGRR